ncbi:MAG: FG-GAP-like repeat-containing protein [Sedimentisphaerales bacterium]|nr:FG-GAP-like repeat-containing protein [Sedimentisphaerales bacterium]HNY78239.1 FG-GAP-like repeat-containing protein [Sedimentisphaerales bacterium]HOC61786.1 FG-GAP-like repeat-containing protein [Sedimentisphaerales bacterium]HOH64360.1 FG-GAP-like repeat-containing protein [Sedimentisphaerales bacterium]HPY48593.1 FG-GAP-like repeat-containing protein [Sedimentisphaerales bacterium]
MGRHITGIGFVVLVSVVLFGIGGRVASGQVAGRVRWQHLSSTTGQIPTPDVGRQVATLILDVDGDGVNDFMVASYEKIAWFRRSADGWTRYAIENGAQGVRLEAGGDVLDIDGDGDLDIVMGAQSTAGEIWWWANPSPDFDAQTPWKRHEVIAVGGTHHDQIFGDFDGDGKVELAFWYNAGKQLYLAEIPADPTQRWPITEIARLSADKANPEGFAKIDINGDGKLDIVGGGHWFEHVGGTTFKAHVIDDDYQFTRSAAGDLIEGGRPEVVIGSGDGVGPLALYEYKDGTWAKRVLIEGVDHGHSLQVGDLDGDGHGDIYTGEMYNPGSGARCRQWVLYGDGRGNFETQLISTGIGCHECRIGDLDGDGDMDILQKDFQQDRRVDVWLNGGTRPGAAGVGAGADFRGPVGLQLYSLRDIFKDNVALGLQLTQNFGFVEVELAGTYGLTPAEFLKRLAWHGLKPIAAHWSYEQWEKDPAAVVAEAKALGLAYAGCAWIPHDGPFDEALCRRAAAVFNRAGEVAAAQGIRFYYHNHGYEFVPHGDGTLFDLLLAETKPELVTYEMDVFWTVHPGQDPVKLLRRYPNRWELFHIKDLKKGVATGKLTGSEDVRNDVVLGTGQIDLRAVLRAAQEIGVRHYFIEDESPTVIQQIPQSLRFLESLSW